MYLKIWHLNENESLTTPQLLSEVLAHRSQKLIEQSDKSGKSNKDLSNTINN